MAEAAQACADIIEPGPPAPVTNGNLTDPDPSESSDNQISSNSYLIDSGVEYPSIENLQCPVCVESFDNVTFLVEHLKSKYLSLPLFRCRHCQQRFLSRSNMVNHIVVSHPSDADKSPVKSTIVTPASSRKLAALVKSIVPLQASRTTVKQTSDSKTTVTTPELDKTENKLKEDAVVSDTPIDGCIKEKECTRCGIYLENESMMQQHLMEKHSAVSSIEASVDDSVHNDFEQQSYFSEEDYDEESDENIEDVDLQQFPFGCDVCSQYFKHAADLNTHKKSTHESSSGFAPTQNSTKYESVDSQRPLTMMKKPICKLCGDIFETFAKLRAHIAYDHLGSIQDDKQSKHSGDDEESFSCKECGRTFTHASLLRHHRLLRHSEERPYQCVHCPKSCYAFRRSLKAHVIRKHGYPSLTAYARATGADLNNQSKNPSNNHFKKGSKVGQSSSEDDEYAVGKGRKRASQSEPIEYGKKSRGEAVRTSGLNNSNSNNNIPVFTTEVIKCGKCEMTFDTTNQLESHDLEAHSVKRPFRCRLCESRFATPLQLRQHISADHSQSKDQPPPAATTNRVKSTQQSSPHLNNPDTPYDPSADEGYTDPNSNIICIGNLKIDPSDAILVRQQGEGHLDASGNLSMETLIRTKCMHCNRLFPIHMIMEHLRFHPSVKPLKCRHCSKKFKNLHLLQKHEIEHENYPQSCDKCDLVFSDEKLLNEHIRTEHRVAITRWKCEFCSASFVTLEERMQHHQVHRRSSAPPAGVYKFSDSQPAPAVSVRCEVCQTEFRNQSALNNHQLENGCALRCADCHTVFSNPQSLYDHNLTTGCGLNDYFSDIKREPEFKKGHSADPAARLHEEAITVNIDLHRSLAKHQCSECNEEFELDSKYERHMRTVHKMKPCVCEVCDREFQYRNQLQAHINRHHPGFYR